MESVDVLIVGARCAGAATAALLAAAGLRVVVADRAPVGSDSVSGLMIKPDGVERLRAWGVLDEVLATGCPPLQWSELVIAGTGERTPVPQTSAAPIAPRRHVLDRILQDHAHRAGATICHRTTFRGRDGDVAWIGDRQIRPRLIIGADGRHSRVAAAVTAPFQEDAVARTCARYGFWDGVGLDGVVAELAERSFAGVFPTNAGQILAFVQVPTGDWRSGGDEREYRANLARCPAVADVLATGRLVGPVLGARHLPTYFRRAAGPGWALVGDAAHHKDPLAARGIADAFFGAQLLAAHVLHGWDRDLDAALGAYAADLDAALRPAAAINDRLAQLDLPPERARTAWRELQMIGHRPGEIALPALASD